MVKNKTKFMLIGLMISKITIIFVIYLQSSQLQNNIFYKLSKPITRKLLLNRKTYVLSTDDYNRLFNISFEFSILNQVCHENVPLLVLILVHSAPLNFRKRQTIRTTWGQVGENKKLLFLIADPGSTRKQKKIEVENAQFGDIIQGNFKDSYKNLTYKHIMALKYFVYHCPHAKFLLKTDDDVFINWPSMENFLTFGVYPYSDRQTIYCVTRTHSPVERNYSKWVVSFNEYPEEVYPPYCLGYILIYTPEVVVALYNEAQQSNSFLWVDDVFVTGILFKKLGYIHTDIEFLELSYEDLYAIIGQSTDITIKPFLFKLLSGIGMKIVWEYISKHAPPRNIYKLYR
ncbi:unnamed protein product [Diabrotica balteata]|uniref:Hexosyltransferase n=1 Tax=Diabrotica balteata TaxID=107213 RepID=A0A9N9TGF7_DIABA|nr:unnamed protein product [Diabrotica balteata]